MTLYTPQTGRTVWYYDNWGATPNATPGAAVASSTTANTEGSWVQVASATNIANDVDGFHLMIHGYSAATNTRTALVDVGVDPAGGTSYTELISDILVGGVPTGTSNTLEMFFPIKIKKGSTVAVRQLARWGAISMRVATRFFGSPTSKGIFPVGSYSETLGSGVTIPKGTEFTPGNAADGTWTSLGVTTKPLWWWQLGYSIYNTVVTAEYTYLELGTGDGTAAGTIPFFRQQHGGSTSEICSLYDKTNLLWNMAYFPVPAGQTIYVRGRCTNAPDTNYNAVAIGVGG